MQLSKKHQKQLTRHRKLQEHGGTFFLTSRELSIMRSSLREVLREQSRDLSSFQGSYIQSVNLEVTHGYLHELSKLLCKLEYGQ